MKIGLVLSAGGLRGAAHLGVLRRLIAARVPIDVIVGCSVGAVIGAFYAAVGLGIDEIIEDAPRVKARHLLYHSLRYHTPNWAQAWCESRSGIVPARLSVLERARFDQLHHGVSSIGIVCHDISSSRPWYFSTADSHGLSLGAVVRASAAVRPFYPPLRTSVAGQQLQLVDGGYSDGMPIEFARRCGATHLIVSDCRRSTTPGPVNDDVLWVRPALQGFGVVRSVSFSLPDAVRAGEAAVTDAVIAQARSWSNKTNPETGLPPASGLVFRPTSPSTAP